MSFDIGAQHFSFNDSGHILDTGNYDFVNFSPDQNESINWNVIGRGASRLKDIGIKARREIEALLGHRVHLELFVKVEEDLRNKEQLLDEFGLGGN